MKHLLTAFFIIATSSSAFAEGVFFDWEKTLGSFYSQMGTLRTPDGKNVASQFAEDTIQHFSGSTGSSVRMHCDAATEAEGVLSSACRVKVTIYYGHHGMENGITEVVTYSFKATPKGDAFVIDSVVRTTPGPS